jgi:hypothetical protein
MRVAQRNTSLVDPSNYTYALDRWQTVGGQDGGFTVSRTAENITGENDNELSLEITAVRTGAIIVQQPLEPSNRYLNKKMTLSMAVKTDPGVRYRLYHGGGFSPWKTGDGTTKIETQTRVSNTASQIARIDFEKDGLAVGTKMYITNVQLIEGEYRPFVPRSLRDEFNACTYYYEKIPVLYESPGNASGGVTHRFTISLAKKRVPPNLSVENLSATNFTADKMTLVPYLNATQIYIVPTAAASLVFAKFTLVANSEI